MLNLLPENKKRLVKKEYHRRLFVVGSVFAILAIGIAIIFLLPSYILTKDRHDQANQDNSVLVQKINDEKSKETNFSDKQKQMLNVLQTDVSTSTPPTDLIDAVLLSKDSNIDITDLSYQIVENTKQLLVHGRAVKREDLISFKQKLEQDENWSDVELPISDLGPATNNEFTFNLTIK